MSENQITLRPEVIELAALLNGREYTNEISLEEAALAKARKLVVVFGGSDDLIEFRGAIHDEGDCYEDATFKFNDDGILPDWPDGEEKDYDDAKEYFDRHNAGFREIKAVWDKDGYAWIYETGIPHATFEILDDDGGKYCRGIVFRIEDMQPLSFR